MSQSPSSARTNNGLSWLGISAWIRRQEWLRSIYRYLPTTLRDRLSLALAAPARARARFVHTPAWKHVDNASAPLASIPVRDQYATDAGVNIFAYFRGQFGLAESARLYARALIEAGYPVALHDIDLNLPHGMGDRTLENYLGEATPFSIHLIFVNPDYLQEAIDAIGRKRFEGRYVIACWFWELEIIPEEWLSALQDVDEILVATRFVEQAFRRVTDKPITCIPLPVTEMADSGLTRQDFGLREDAFIFLLTFDFNSWLDRKNPFAAINAFSAAFPPERNDVQLLVKSSNGHRHPEQFLRLLAAAKNDPRIIVRDEVIDRAHVHALQRSADAYISLHRSEGFGLGMAESMRLGKPVVATHWSGNVDFMEPSNSCPVNYRLVPVNEGEYLHWRGQHWAEADVQHAAEHMRRLVDEPEYAKRLGGKAASDIRLQLSMETAAKALIERLQTLHANLSRNSSLG
ncbi:MAG: glycosyltransferase family 4 protein [Xanthomonadaceae bacterium]|jgi:glycosyltransferase involved in cell wall biosynthesis|nr:glycosyltransferase family 4 protein [Xanthomonadaceae bacterium]